MPAEKDELRSHLDSGEKLLWAGRPAQGIMLMWQDGFLIPFGMVWLGSAVRFSIQGSCLKRELAAIRVVRRGGPVPYWDGHLFGHWTPLRRPLAPIPNDLRRHGSARYHLIGHASSLRALDIFFLPHHFEARRAPESQRHDLLWGGSSNPILLGVAHYIFPSS